MSEVIAFLRARLDEEEQVVRTLDEEYGNQVTGIEIYTDRDYGPIIAIGQKWALADIQAKRRILDKHQPGEYGECVTCDVGAKSCGCCGWGDHPCDTVRLLALPYADHSDYREEWRP